MRYRIKSFGEYKTEQYDEIYITNDNNLTFAFTNLGARVTKVLYPYQGREINLVLSYDNAKDTIQGREYFYGATIGRVAGRIKNGQFKLNDKNYFLEKNDDNSHLHGGLHGYDILKWDYEIQSTSNCTSIIFFIDDPIQLNNYPGNVKVKVQHTIDNKNQWTIKYEALSDMDTIFDPTNHVYFNLNTNNGYIYNHQLKVKSNLYVPVNKNTLPIKSGDGLEKTSFDFEKFQDLSTILMSKNCQIRSMGGLDHAFLLKNDEGYDVSLVNKRNSIKVYMKTDRPAVVIYTHNKINKGIFSPYRKHEGIAIEAQALPNSINISNRMQDVILKAGNEFKSKTTYRIESDKE